MATLTPRQRPSFRNLSQTSGGFSTPSMPRKSGPGENIEVGDAVEVPGGMDGVVKFVGEVKGKPGFFVGVELSRKWASRGKNDGDAEGHRYFSTSIPGAGIFLPINRAVKLSSPATSVGSAADRSTLSERGEKSPPTPTVPSKFSQSVSGRAASPALRPKSRPSLPRPESPLRRSQIASNAATPRPSLNALPANRLNGPKYAASPTPNKQPTKSPVKNPSFSSSVRGMPPRAPSRAEREYDDEVAQLKAVIQEKNEKIALLTAEFDNHRADFRSTLDTLELASTETERVYEKRVEDLLEERRMLMAQGEDVESVAEQLRALEEVVQELEEGLEDARRGEAEARGEVEFLRGEVERVRAELRREREKHAPLTPSYNERAQAAPKHGLASPTPAKKELSPAPLSPPAPLSVTKNQAPQANDPDKWCALCEQDGHDSISCPYDK